MKLGRRKAGTCRWLLTLHCCRTVAHGGKPKDINGPKLEFRGEQLKVWNLSTRLRMLVLVKRR
jgi:hypothetical protein